MRVFILDKEKITKFNLPEKIAGVFAIDYLPINSKIKRTISIEALDGNWIVKSNGSVNVIGGNLIQEHAILKEYTFQQIQVRGREDCIGIYCMPSIESNFVRYTIQNGSITIGSANDVSISYANNLALPHHISIDQAQDGYYITAADDPLHYAYVNDKKITKNFTDNLTAVKYCVILCPKSKKGRVCVRKNYRHNIYSYGK